MVKAQRKQKDNREDLGHREQGVGWFYTRAVDLSPLVMKEALDDIVMNMKEVSLKLDSIKEDDSPEKITKIVENINRVIKDGIVYHNLFLVFLVRRIFSGILADAQDITIKNRNLNAEKWFVIKQKMTIIEIFDFLYTLHRCGVELNPKHSENELQYVCTKMENLIISTDKALSTIKSKSKKFKKIVSNYSDQDISILQQDLEFLMSRQEKDLKEMTRAMSKRGAYYAFARDFSSVLASFRFLTLSNL